jgi:DNA (cytosine-5)-methyltransferase 1
MTDLTAVSLFAGIGGFDLALTRAGVNVVAAVEIDPAARKVLARRFPDVTLFEDVQEVTGDQLRAAGFVPERGIVTAGWPCQGNSVAGRRGGLADPRSGLWSHVRRLLAETSAAWFIGENVPGLLSVNSGEDFAVVLDDLADLGMGFCWRVLDAQHFGVPQRRRRVFVVGRAGRDARGPVEVLLEPEGRSRAHAPGGEAGQDVAGTLGGGSGARGWTPDTDRMTFVPVAFDAAQITSRTNRSNPQPGDPAPSLAATGLPMAFNPQTGGDMRIGYGDKPTALARKQVTAVQLDTAVRRLTPLECERLQGFPDGWTEGQSDAARYRELGNAVAVPCVEWVARRVVAADRRGVAA